MGLSDQERNEKLYWACHNLTERDRNLPAEVALLDLRPLRTAIGQLWPAFLRHNSRTTHWLLGSSATNTVTEADSPWSAALLGHFQKAQQDESKLKGDDFDPFDGLLNIEGLLTHSHLRGTADVWAIFAWSEEATYALRRYDDSYLEKHRELDNALSIVQGVCYGVFQADEIFACAYLLNQILVKLYQDKDLAKVFTEGYWHHALSRPITDHDPLRTVMKWDRALIEAKTPQDRIQIAIEIVGRKADKFGCLKSIPPKWLEAGAIQKLLHRAEKLRETKKHEDDTYYSHEIEEATRAAVHGYDYIRQAIQSRKHQGEITKKKKR